MIQSEEAEQQTGYLKKDTDVERILKNGPCRSGCCKIWQKHRRRKKKHQEYLRITLIKEKRRKR